MRPKTSRIPIDGGSALATNPFAALPVPDGSAGLRPAAGGDSRGSETRAPSPARAPVRRGVVHLRIEKAGRAGKTVTVLFGDGLERASDAERADLLRSFKRALGVGGATGTAANPRTGAAVPTLEFQGDERARLTVLLRREGFSI